MGEIFWINEICDADNRVKAKSAALCDYFATKTIEEALRSYEEARSREGGAQRL